jgi:hypothetical protein
MPAPAVSILGRIPFAPTSIAILTERGAVRTRKPVKPGRQAYPPGGTGAWRQRGHIISTVQCLAPYCTHRVDVPLATLPQEQPWSRVGPAMLCSECGEPGRVNITPNWRDVDQLQVSKWWHSLPR